jgi:hypothetical protein
MFPKQAVSTFINALNSRIPPPVHTAGIEDERPVPAVIIENIQMENKNHHNSHTVGQKYDDSGYVNSEIKRHYYSLRLELLVRDDDETDAFNHLATLQEALSEIEDDPRNILDHSVHEVRTLGSNGVSYQFYEPTETEINQSVVLETYYETDKTDVDAIESIPETYNIS